jgi:hypothetical protein
MTNQLSKIDQADLFFNTIKNINFNLNCHRVGIIQSFDASKQLANVSIVDKSIKLTGISSEELVDMPLLENCPVMVAKNINGGLTIPINTGDACLVCFNDRDLDNWLESGLIQRPNTDRTHDFSDGIIIAGIRNDLNKIDNFNNLATELNYLNNLISIDSEKINLINQNGGSIIINDKLELKNTADDLKSILEELVNIITNLKTVDPVSGNLPIDSGTASALSSLTSRIGGLLK